MFIKHNDKLSKGIKVRLCLMMFFLIFLSIGITAIFNMAFLDDYYAYKVKENYERTYKDLKNITEKNLDHPIIKRTEYDYYVSNLTKYINCSVLILHGNTEETGLGYSLYAGNENKQYMKYKLVNYVNGIKFPNTQINKKYENGMIQTIEENDSYNHKKKVYELWGRLDDDTSFLIVSNIEDIKNTLRISTQFLILIGIIFATLSSALAVVLLNRFTAPINRLNKITKEMAGMNFDIKYTEDSFKEINELGENINKMSNQLQEYIAQLKKKNTSLKQALSNRDDIDIMRKEFISNVSHELKTPIALISGYAEGLKCGINDSSKEDREFYCDVIIDEANRMNGMVRDLLLLMELEFGNQEFDMERFDIVEFIKNLVESYRLYEQKEGLKIKLINANKSIMIWSDVAKLETVFRNFISNAFNHVDENKEISISFKIKENEDRVRISVFNSGKPIPEESKSRIWDKFYKVDKARTREYGGNGVGLSIVKAILEKNKRPYGFINRDNGVEFFIEIDINDDTKV